MIITFEEKVKQINLGSIGYFTETFRILINSKIGTGLI